MSKACDLQPFEGDSVLHSRHEVQEMERFELRRE